MRIRTCWGCCALALTSTFSASADYSWQLSGLLGSSEREEPSTSFESDEASLSATYYFDPVEEDGTGPRALTAFFDPATRLSVSASRDEQSTMPTAPAGVVPLVGEIDASDYSASGQYLLPRSKWYVGGRYARGELEDPPSTIPITQSSADLRAYGVVAGKYLGARGATRLQLSLDRSKTENDLSIGICIPTCFTGTAVAAATTDDVTLDVMHVGKMRSATYALLGGISEASLKASFTPPVFTGPGGLLPPISGGSVIEIDGGTVRSYSVGGELYPVANVGIRIGYTELDTPVSDGNRIDVGASWFFRANVGLELTLSREDPGDLASDTERTALRVIGRF